MLVQPQVVAVTHLLDPLQSLTVLHLSFSLHNKVLSRCVQFACLHADVLPVELYPLLPVLYFRYRTLNWRNKFNRFFDKLAVAQLFHPSSYNKPQGPLPCLQLLVTNPYPESNPLQILTPWPSFPRSLPSWTVNRFYTHFSSLKYHLHAQRIIFYLTILTVFLWSAIPQLFQALRYKPDRRFNSGWGLWHFSLI